MAIVGVVAALTIPSLVQNISDRAKKAQKDTIEARLLEGFNQLNTLEDGFTAKYETTEDFVKALSKYYKMSSICGADNIDKCWPYEKIKYTDESNAEQEMEVKDLTKPSSFGLEDDDYLAPASFINGQGTPFFIAMKKECIHDTGKALRDLTDTGCVALMYDSNGTRMPNRYGTKTENEQTVFTGDLISKGGMKIADAVTKFAGVKLISSAFVPTPMTSAECEANKSKYGISECAFDNDYWAGAMKACQDMGGRLPNEQELTAMAQVLYNDPTITTADKSGLTLDTSKIPSELSGLGSSWLGLWSSHVDSRYAAYGRNFTSSGTRRYYDGRYSSSIRAVCVAN